LIMGGKFISKDNLLSGLLKIRKPAFRFTVQQVFNST